VFVWELSFEQERLRRTVRARVKIGLLLSPVTLWPLAVR